MALGNPIDVKNFAAELGLSNVTILAKENGNQLDYDHINMLVASRAVNDHFIEVIKFLAQAEK